MPLREIIVAAVVGVGVLVPRAGGQIGYLWTYEELLTKADVVVIAECRSTVDTGHSRHPELRPGLPVVEMQTTFGIEAILKSSGKSIVVVHTDLRLRHFRLDIDGWKREHPTPPGGVPAGFVNAGTTVLPDIKRTYLLFLKIAADGVYEPLSGHTFPTNSVFRLDGLPSSSR